MVHTYYTATKKDAHEKPFITWGNAWLSESKVGLQEKILLKERAWWCVTFKKPCIYALSRRCTSHVGVLELREVLQSDDGTEPSFIPSFPGLVMTEAFSKEPPPQPQGSGASPCLTVWLPVGHRVSSRWVAPHTPLEAPRSPLDAPDSHPMAWHLGVCSQSFWVGLRVHVCFPFKS